MISLIICSRTELINHVLENNIAETIGTGYEIVLIDNSENKYSIFQAYNMGVEQSKYACLCFMHDDIIYHTKNWGKNVLKHFEDENTGAIGIAGSPYFPQMPAAWWSSGIIYEYILQSGKKGDTPVLKKTGYEKTNVNQVVALDGVWFCVRKTLFAKIKFDDALFKGFHFYDVDICLQLNQQGYKIFCVSDVLIQHFSQGCIDNSWIEDAVKLCNKWRFKLPVSCIPLSYGQRCKIEFKALAEYILIRQHSGVSVKESYRQALYETLKFYNGYLFYKTPGYILKYFLKSI